RKRKLLEKQKEGKKR
ncbi:hypothetical protein OSA56_02605, partial [Treponema pallidum]